MQAKKVAFVSILQQRERVTKRLLLTSVHDVSPRFESEVDRLIDHLAPHVGKRIALLVVPNHWGSSLIGRGTPFATRIRDWADQGMEIFVHGWFHRDESVHATAATRFRAAHLTAGEGEFLSLDRETAARRMREGRALIEDIIGQPVAGFIAPAWLYGEGARRALADTDMALAESHWRVWSPRENRMLLKSPVITWASRSRGRRWSSLALAATVRRVMMPGLMRVGVHPPDVHVPALMASIDKTLARLRRTRAPAGYRDLLGT